MISVSVDVGTHADALALMRVLDGFHPWTVQHAPDRWIVVAPAERGEGVDTALALVSGWADEHHPGPLACRAGENELLLHSTDGATPL